MYSDVNSKNSGAELDADYEARLKHLEALLKHRDLQNEMLQDTLYTLSRWVEELDGGINTLLDSKRWKIGSLIGELFRLITLRPKEPMPDEYLKKILTGYRAWRQSPGSVQRTLQVKLDKKHDYFHTPLLPAQDDAALLISWVQKLEFSTGVILKSKQWSIGSKLGRLKRKIFLQSRSPEPEEYLLPLFDEFNFFFNHEAEPLELVTLISYLNRITEYLEDLLLSFRWRFGSKLFRTDDPTLTIYALIQDYRKWLKDRH